MQRIGTSDGLFVNGNPAAGVLGTVCTAEWLNAVQEEISGVILGAGFPLNPATYSQLLNCIIELIHLEGMALATSAETIAGVRNDLAITPSGLAALTANTDRNGLARLATLAELKAGASSTLVPPVATLMALFSNSGGVVKLPKGVVMQTGMSGAVGYDTSVTLSFPEAFSSTPFVVPVIKNASDANDDVYPRLVSVTASQVTLRSERAWTGDMSGTRYIGYFAIGTITD